MGVLRARGALSRRRFARVYRRAATARKPYREPGAAAQEKRRGTRSAAVQIKPNRSEGLQDGAFEARRWFERAAVAGGVEGMVNLGLLEVLSDYNTDINIDFDWQITYGSPQPCSSRGVF
jgi:hypothetical protein